MRARQASLNSQRAGASSPPARPNDRRKPAMISGWGEFDTTGWEGGAAGGVRLGGLHGGRREPN